MERFFNTAGPNRLDYNYTIDPLSRFDLEEILMLIAQQKYFASQGDCPLVMRKRRDDEQFDLAAWFLSLKYSWSRVACFYIFL